MTRIYFLISYQNYIKIDQNQINAATSTTELFGKEIKHLVKTEDDIYGSKDFPLDSATIAKLSIANSLQEVEVDNFKDLNFIKLSDVILLFDANEKVSFNAFNFTIPNKNIYGYIVIAAHTRAPLIKEIKYNTKLPLNATKVYYFSEGEFYFLKKNHYETITNLNVSEAEFYGYKLKCKAHLYNLTIELLDSIELDTTAMINNMVFLTTATDEDILLQTRYSGQDSNAYGYGGINDIPTYLSNRYGGTVSYSSGKMLSTSNFTMSQLGSGGICSLTAITRILVYYRTQGYTKIDSTKEAVYKKVRAKAINYGFTDASGTFPTRINNIAQDVLRDYGYKNSYSQGIYVWSFGGQVKNEINANRPVIMNIARGYYGNHSVTVNGYKIYKTAHKVFFMTTYNTHNMIAVYDGWTTGQRYIDYEAFTYDLISSGFGSFNTVVLKS